MNTRMRGDHVLERHFSDPGDAFFGRTVEDILAYDFFNSFDTNMREERDHYTLQVAVPGMTRKDVTVHVDGAVMQVSAQKQRENTSWNSMEFDSKQFRRSFALPADADVNSVKAKCRDGLLTIRIGKIRSKEMRRVIKIGGGESGAQLSSRVRSWWGRQMHNVRQWFAGRR